MVEVNMVGNQHVENQDAVTVTVTVVQVHHSVAAPPDA